MTTQHASPPLPPTILLLGPTASGKTDLALNIVDALADTHPVDLISVDSALVFKDMNIGTAKPDAATLACYPHALIDLITPEQSYCAARFRNDALTAMAESTRRGHLPLLVGGTMLYVKALFDGLADLPQASPELRAEINARAAQHGWPALHAELARLDPITAARLASKDAQRIQRALEICLTSGQPLSALYAAHQQQAAPPYRFLTLSLLPSDRGWLHERIAQRFKQMLQQGLVAEVEALRSKYRLDASLPAMRCVGYRQVWEMLDGRLPAAELEARGIYATRQLAKRQITWLNNSIHGEVFDCINPQLTTAVLGRLREFLHL